MALVVRMKLPSIMAVPGIEPRSRVRRPDGLHLSYGPRSPKSCRVAFTFYTRGEQGRLGMWIRWKALNIFVMPPEILP